MKTTLIAFASLLALPALAQQAQEVEMAGHQHVSPGAYRPGEVLVKFKADSRVSVRHKANGAFASTSLSAVDAILREVGAEAMEPLMPLTGHHVSPHKVRSYSGTPVSDTDLSQLFCVRVKEDAQQPIDVLALVSRLAALDEVEYAEPNYLVYTLDAVENPNDPMLGQQNYLGQVNVSPLWSVPQYMDRRPVIADAERQRGDIDGNGILDAADVTALADLVIR